MYYNITVPVPNVPGKIYRQEKNGVTYILYEYARVYHAEKKYNTPKRTTIGKACTEEPSRMYPNPNFLKYFPEAKFPLEDNRAERSGCLRIGNYLVIRKLLRQTRLLPIVESLYGDPRGVGLFLDLAAYYIITQCNAGQYFPDYAYNHPLFTPEYKIYSDSTVSRFLREISMEDSICLQNAWNEKKDHWQRIYISYDSTNKNCQAGDISFVEYGHPKDNKGLPVFNVSVAYDTRNREPLFYEEYPGSIVDVAQLQFMLEKARRYGYKHIGFILDRGYFSKANIHYMDRCGYDFVIMVKGLKALVKEAVREVQGTFETKRSFLVRRCQTHGVTLKKQLYPSDAGPRYFHIYYSPDKNAAERSLLDKRLTRMEELLRHMEGKPYEMEPAIARYYRPEYCHEGTKDQCFVTAYEREDVIEEELQLCGYYCIITSAKMTAKEALELYKSRDASEKLFKADKTFLGGKSERMYTEEGLGGKLLIGFVSLIIRNRMYTCLRDAVGDTYSVPNYMNVAAAIRELEKIEILRGADGIYRLDHAVTKTQKTILDAFGMGADDIRTGAEEISNAIRPENMIAAGGLR